MTVLSPLRKYTERNEGAVEMMREIIDDGVASVDEQTHTGELDLEEVQEEYDDGRYEAILAEPKKAVYNFGLAIREYLEEEAGIDVDSLDVNVNVINRPETNQIEDLKADYEGQLVTLNVAVEHVAESYEVNNRIGFTCSQCETKNPIWVTQDQVSETRLKPEHACGNCESRQYWSMDVKEIVSKQLIDLSDPYKGRKRPDTIIANAFGNHIDVASPGEKIEVTGIVIPVYEGENKARLQILVTGLSNYAKEDKINITEEEIERFQELQNDPDVEQKLIDSIAPQIVGEYEMKQASLYATASGDYDTNTRSISHVLFIGDPGVGKSKILKFIKEATPRASIVGENSTGVGITGSYQRHEETGEESLKPGPMVHSSGSVCCVDELDKFKERDLNRLYTALSEGVVRGHKGGVNAEMPAKTIVIGAANPKDGVFKSHESIQDQFDFPAPLLDRADLIIPIEDSASEEDKEKAEAIFGSFTEDDGPTDPPLSKEEFGRFIYYIKNIQDNPTIPAEVQKWLTETYKEKRAELDSDDDTEGIGIDNRTAGAFARLSLTSARIRGRDEVTIEDAQRAVQMVLDSLKAIGNGKIDASVKYSGETTKEAKTRQAVLECIEKLEMADDTEVTREEVERRVIMTKDGFNQKTVRHYIDKHLKEGNIYELDEELHLSN